MRFLRSRKEKVETKSVFFAIMEHTTQQHDQASWSFNYTVQKQAKRHKNIALYSSMYNKRNFVISNLSLPRSAKNEVFFPPDESLGVVRPAF